MLKYERVTASQVPTEFRSGVCPKCKHSASGEGWDEDPIDDVSRRLRKLFRLRPVAASCKVAEYDTSGLAPLPCGCKDPFHGS
jgi:hypothetical protein